MKRSILHEGRRTLTLAIPLIIGQISQMLMAIADTAMVGKLGVTELAALTFASAVFSVPFVFGIGVIISISILTSGAIGRNDHTEARSTCRNGLYLALVTGSILFLLSCGILPFLPYFKQPADVTAMAPPYLSLILASLVPALGAMALKNHGDSLGSPWPSFFIFLSGVLLNILLNQILIYGLGPIPAMGLVGAGWATLIARSCILIAMIIWLKKSKTLSHLTPYRWLAKPDFSRIKRLLAVGIPTSLQLLAEVGAFSAAGLLVGLYGEVPLAGHQIALTTAGTVFMIPLGISMAVTVRTGQAYGAQESSRYPAIIYSSWGITLFFIAITASLCMFGNTLIAGLYIDKHEVITQAASFLFIVGVFQFVDAIQVVSSGILRGIEDVNAPAWTAFVSYWILGIPLGWLLATRGGMKAEGIWWGLAIGLTAAAVTLSARALIRTRQLRLLQQGQS